MRAAIALTVAAAVFVAVIVLVAIEGSDRPTPMTDAYERAKAAPTLTVVSSHTPLPTVKENI